MDLVPSASFLRPEKADWGMDGSRERGGGDGGKGESKEWGGAQKKLFTPLRGSREKGNKCAKVRRGRTREERSPALQSTVRRRQSGPPRFWHPGRFQGIKGD